MLFTIPTQNRPTRLSMKYQTRNSVFQNKQSTLENENLTMRSINTALSEQANSKKNTSKSMRLLFQFRKSKSSSNSSSKQRLTNVLVEEYKKIKPQQIIFPFFPTKNNNMTLENMPVLNAGRLTYVSFENEPEPEPETKLKYKPTWEINKKDDVKKTVFENIQVPANITNILLKEDTIINKFNFNKDVVVNNVPVPIVPWKPSWNK